MLGFGQVKCFSCNKKIKKKHAFTTVIQTAEGEHTLKLCSPCGEEMNVILKEIEDSRNERSDSV